MNRVVVGVLAAFLLIGAGEVAAQVYEGGYYTALCGSRTGEVLKYNCEADCVPSSGECSGINSGVVRYECDGKSTQCSKNESGWSNSEQIGVGVVCGKTIQLTVFDQKCRLSNGGWLNGCKVLGYMTWYSGDCYSVKTPVPEYTASPSAVLSPTAKVSPTPTPKLLPTATLAPTTTISLSPTAVISPTVTPVVTEAEKRRCNAKCIRTSECVDGLMCFMGYCRNSSCQKDIDCLCGEFASTESAAVAEEVPETGMAVYSIGALMVGLTILGWVLRNKSRELW